MLFFANELSCSAFIQSRSANNAKKKVTLVAFQACYRLETGTWSNCNVIPSYDHIGKGSVS